MKAQKSLDRLIKGNTRFVENQLDGKLRDNARRESLISEQNPFAIILSCADSRVVPELIFDTGLGEIFVVRVAGNIANTSSIASIEFAVANLDPKIIVVLGHQNCGAVTAAVKGGNNGNNLNRLLKHIKPAIISLKHGSTINEIGKKNAELTAKELKSKSLIIKNAVSSGEVEIVSAYYNLDSGKVDFL